MRSKGKPGLSCFLFAATCLVLAAVPVTAVVGTSPPSTAVSRVSRVHPAESFVARSLGVHGLLATVLRSSTQSPPLAAPGTNPSMTRYFFTLREGAALIDDPEGCEFPTLVAARAAATSAARELVAMDLWANRPARLHRIEICDAAGQLLGTVSVQDALTDTEELADPLAITPASLRSAFPQ